MLKFVLLSTEDQCKELSAALHYLSRPRHIQDQDGDGPSYLFPWFRHPGSGLHALAFYDDYQYRKHPDVNMMLTAPGDPYGSQALMQSLFLPIAADGANSLQALLAYILANDVIDTGEILPLVDPVLVKTQAEMDADGWFPVLME
jgi:hypothetical protein